jgi:hypothetical protein
MSLLTTNQIRDLAVIVLGEWGPCLNDDELTEQVAMLLEDISGFETTPEQVVRRVINQVRSHYHVASSQDTDHRNFQVGIHPEECRPGQEGSCPWEGDDEKG